jgi:hypothetical protein
MAENPDSDYRFRLSRKEWVTLIFGTALALGSFKSDDPWVVIPMLTIAGVAFVLLCRRHHGRIVWRVLVALALLCALVFIGWRDLYHVPKETGGSSPAPPQPTINQTSTGSDCSNLAAGSDSQIKCEAERERHEKDKNSH